LDAVRFEADFAALLRDDAALLRDDAGILRDDAALLEPPFLEAAAVFFAGPVLREAARFEILRDEAALFLALFALFLALFLEAAVLAALRARALPPLRDLEALVFADLAMTTPKSHYAMGNRVAQRRFP
jgi:hypothetical protein